MHDGLGRDSHCPCPIRTSICCCARRLSKPDCCDFATARKDRIVEPHDYGQHNGVIKLLTYQVGGFSSGPLPNWRWMETDLIAEAELLDQTFPGGRPTSSGGQTGRYHTILIAADRLTLRCRKLTDVSAARR